jgi:hypothetical protein
MLLVCGCFHFPASSFLGTRLVTFQMPSPAMKKAPPGRGSWKDYLEMYFSIILANPETRSIGNGKTIVVFFSTPISVRVWR